jgi:hypothetical protein
MSKKTAYTLIAIGLALQVLDLATSKNGTGGVVFGDSGFLKPVDDKIPKLTLFRTNAGAVQTNMAFWLIVAGVLFLLIKR